MAMIERDPAARDLGDPGAGWREPAAPSADLHRTRGRRARPTTPGPRLHLLSRRGRRRSGRQQYRAGAQREIARAARPRRTATRCSSSPAYPRSSPRSRGRRGEKLGKELNLSAEGVFKFCWVVDFPMYERDEETKQIVFSHNPFSMPQGGLDALENQDPLTIKAFQYDIVCNGIELSSGAITQSSAEVMIKAFTRSPAIRRPRSRPDSGGLLDAFRFGAPPHGGSAPGIDRIVMLLADTPNIRRGSAFPMNQQAQDLMMQAPAEVPPERLRELHIRLALPPAASKSGG